MRRHRGKSASTLPNPSESLAAPILSGPPRETPGDLVARFNPTARIVRDGDGMPETLGRMGALEVRLARTTRDIRRAQRLRFKVFFEEMSATPNARAFFSRRDIDAYDRICDHILVIDHEAGRTRFGRAKPKVVGTYRLLRSDVAARHDSDFYTAGEFDLAPLIAAHPGARMLEMGRSCVLKAYRGKRTVELLWHGVWTYVLHHKIELMFGCASLEGASARAHALPLAFLHHYASMPAAGAVKALPWRHVDMAMLDKDKVDVKAAMRALPPLIKGYLRLGARFGDGAVVDAQFGTTDVFVALKVSEIDPRYIGYFGADGSRHAA